MSVLPVSTPPGSPACVLFTSGSTGRPKGVTLSHAALANYVRSEARALGVGPADRVAQRCPAGFDGALFELMLALTTGATSVTVPTDVAGRPEDLADLVNERGITVLVLVPSLLALHVDAGTFAVCPTLTTVLTAGEALPVALARAFAAQSPARLFNFYGPTEAGVGVSRWRYRGDEEAATVPIGTPTANVHLHVLDRRGQVVPVGAPGELHVGGVQLATGYLGEPGLTADRFGPDHLSGIPGARLYRTGDVVRRLPGGELEFLGRSDNQLKVNGVRVELEEVEAALHDHPAVRQAAVAVRQVRPDRSGLVGYVVWDGDPGALSVDLRAFLRERLPEAMIPQRFLALEALPVSPNGKVDRGALPEPEPAPVRKDAPRDPVEARLCALWEETLGVPVVGIREDFFELGGHSLLALRLAMRIRQEFDRDLPVETVLSAPTVALLADVLRGPADVVPDPVVSFGGSGARPPLFFCPPLGGQAFRYRPLARHLAAGGPVYGISSRGFAEGETPSTTMAEMVADYVGRIREVVPHGPYLLGGLCVGGNIALEVARELRAGGDDVPLVVMLWSNADQPVIAEQLEDDAKLMMYALAGGAMEIEDLPAAGSADEQLLAVLDAAAAAGRLTPGGAELADARRVLAVYRANAHAVADHQHAPYDGDVALLVPVDDPALRELGDYGWPSRIGGDYRAVPIAGDRGSCMREPLVTETARHVVAAVEARVPAS